MVPPRPVAFGVCSRTPAIKSTQITTSAITRGPLSLSISTTLASLALESLGDCVPVDYVPPGGDVVGALVLVLEVVSMLPHIHAQDRCHALHQRAVLVRPRDDRELAAAVAHEPAPATAELADCGFAEVVFECRKIAKRALDGIGKLAFGFATGVRTHDFPEH